MKAFRLLGAAVAALALSGCEPVYEGPQLSEVPEGLAYLTSIRSSRLPLPDRRLLAQYAYAAPGGADWKTSVMISEYEGACSRAEVESAREAYAVRYGGGASRYGPVEGFEAGGRRGWAYTVDGVYRGQVDRHGLTVVVPWDEKSYSIEVSSSETRWMDRELQRRMAASFHVARRGRYRGPLLVLFIAAGAVWLFLDRRKRRT